MMEKIKRRVEVLTHIDSVKIVNSKEEGMLDVQFNQGDLVVFKFDGSMFYVSVPNRDEIKKFTDKKEKEHAKLNRALTQSENEQDMKEFHQLPSELEEIEVLFTNSVTEEPVNLVLYINELIKGL